MIYQYEAKKGVNEIVRGQIEAATESHALELIRSDGMFPLSVTLDKEDVVIKKGTTRKKSSFKATFSLFRESRDKLLVSFTRRLAVLLRSKVSLIDALSVLKEKEDNELLCSLLSSMYKKVRDGGTISDGMSDHGSFFSPFYIGVVRAGESSGALHNALSTLESFVSKRMALKRRIQAAMAYPLLLAFVGFVTLSVLMYSVIPKIGVMFGDLGRELPIYTKWVIYIADFFRDYGLLFLFSAAVSFFVFRVGVSRYRNSVFLWLKSHTPFIRKIFQDEQMLLLCTTLGLLLKNGVSLVTAVSIAADSVEMKSLRYHLLKVSEDISRGEMFSQSLENNTDLPGYLIKMISVGESSGALDSVLEEASSEFQVDIDQRIGVMSSLIEPLLILLMGVVLGGIIMSILVPIFQITQVMH